MNLYGGQTYSGNISGIGNLLKAGNGTLTLAASHGIFRNHHHQRRNLEPVQ